LGRHQLIAPDPTSAIEIGIEDKKLIAQHLTAEEWVLISKAESALKIAERQEAHSDAGRRAAAGQTVPLTPAVEEFNRSCIDQARDAISALQSLAGD
jgi:hypothetical protein